MSEINIYKLDHTGRSVWYYPGEVLSRDLDKVVVSARFTQARFCFNGMLLKKDDHFIEAYFRKKWYNIFEIYDRDEGHLKGWYCNVTRPAVISRWQISYEDLALDLFVHYCGETMLLDEDEFNNLELAQVEKEKAWTAVEELRSIFKDQTFRLKIT